MVSKEAVFLISVATEKFIERLAQAGQSVAERQSRATIQERDICEHKYISHSLFLTPDPGAVVRGIEEFAFLWGKCTHLPSDSVLQ